MKMPMYLLIFIVIHFIFWFCYGITIDKNEHYCKPFTIKQHQLWMNAQDYDRYDSGVLDGIVGSKTIAAWENYSIDRGHDADMRWFKRDVRREAGEICSHKCIVHQ